MHRVKREALTAKPNPRKTSALTQLCPTVLPEAPPVLVKLACVETPVQFLSVAAITTARERLMRLVSDAQMGHVFRELNKKDRRTRDYFYDGRKAPFKAASHDDRITALLTFAVAEPLKVTKAELTRRKRKLARLAQHARKLLAEADQEWWFSYSGLPLAQPLRECAEHADHLARTLSAAVPVVTDRSNSVRSAYLRRLSGAAEFVFGRPLDGIVARIANVVLERRDVTVATVRGARKQKA